MSITLNVQSPCLELGFQKAELHTGSEWSIQCPALSTTKVKFLQRYSDDHLNWIWRWEFLKICQTFIKIYMLFQWLYSSNLFTKMSKQHVHVIITEMCQQTTLSTLFSAIIFVSVWLFQYIFIAMFIILLETFELNYLNISLYADVCVCPSPNRHNAWLQFQMTLWAGAPVHFNYVYRYVSWRSQVWFNNGYLQDIHVVWLT